MTIHYIILNDKIILSKKSYTDWRQIQDEYPDSYMSSLGPWTQEELLSYLADDFTEETNWPFSKQDIINFFNSSSSTITSSH